MASELICASASLASLRRGGFALGGERRGGFLIILRRRIELRTQRFENLVAVFHLGQLARNVFAERDHLGDRLAVLALQPVEQRQAVFNLGQPLGRCVDAFRVIAQLALTSPTVARADASCCAASVNRPS